MAGIAARLKNTQLYKGLIQWLDTHSLPGFHRIPLLVILRFIRQELRKESLVLRANAMAFSFFLSLFPSIIFLFTLLPYLPIDGFVQTLKVSLEQILPLETANYLNRTIDELTSIPRTGLLSVGLLLSLFFASNGMISMLRGFEKRYAISYRIRSGMHRRLVAIQLTVLLGTLIVLALALIVIGHTALVSFLNWIGIRYDAFFVIMSLRWLAVVLLFYSSISILYRYGPAMKRRVHFFSPGATLATSLALCTSLLFSYYVNSFNIYNKIYGSLGALIALMLWLQINSLIILIGYELNAGIAVSKDLREK